MVLSNNRSALQHYTFVCEELKILLRSGRIREVDSPSYVSSPLSVSTSGEKKRLILDLSKLNFHVYKEKIKFDDWKSMQPFIRQDVFMFKFDLKQGYHHVDIFEEHMKFLGFSWIFNGKVQYFKFTVLPFGLTSAPFIFTKIMRVLVKLWRQNNICISCYLDDGLGMAESYAKAKADSTFVRSSLMGAGFVCNEKKSQWEPTQTINWLGIQYDSRQASFCIPESRVKSLFAVVNRLLFALPYSSARKIARLCGTIISTQFVLGNIVRLKTRRLYEIIAQ